MKRRLAIPAVALVLAGCASSGINSNNATNGLRPEDRVAIDLQGFLKYENGTAVPQVQSCTRGGDSNSFMCSVQLTEGTTTPQNYVVVADGNANDFSAMPADA
jgi:hypothetical protein